MQRVLGISAMGAAIVLATVAAGGATMVQRMALDHVTRTADRIVHATVLDVHSGRDESGLPATWVTLDVARALKGAAAGHVTIKQYGTAEPLPDGTITRVVGLPRYHVGEEVVVFLHRDSRLGFSSPVGLGQGLYRVKRTAAPPMVHNDLGGQGQHLDEFLSKVTRLAAAD